MTSPPPLSAAMHRHLSPSTFPRCPSRPCSLVPRWRGHEHADGCHTTCQIPPPRRYTLCSCEALIFWALITDLVVLSPPGPSTPPEELQLSALDSSSVMASWRPPLEPNGIITSYKILFSSNLSQPEHMWENLSQDGGRRTQILRRLFFTILLNTR